MRNVASQHSTPGTACVLAGQQLGRPTARRLRVLFVVEGYTDIRFVTGLSEICELSMLLPAKQYHQSGLHQRILTSGAELNIHLVKGGRIRYQAASLAFLLRRTKNFDVILSQEILRGSLNSCLVGRLYHKPVITYMNVPPLQYFRCRRERKLNSWMKAKLGETVIRFLIWTTAKLANRCVAVGPYMAEIASRHCSRVTMGYAYGVDVNFYSPVPETSKVQLRTRLKLPLGKFLVLSGSRVSHEKDPETLLHAVALARAQGLDAVVLNLGGGYQDFLHLAQQLSLPDADQWVLGRPAAHPMIELADYYRTADVLAQASLDEGAGMTTLEALACGVPVVCTSVGGMARIVPDYATLTLRRDAEAMAKAFLWISTHPELARAQALRGREFVSREWSRERAFLSLSAVLTEEAQRS
jgi:glycosyltransferase involved in cell wall biosynthesis